MLFGRTQTLIISHRTQDGYYLRDAEMNEVLLPERHIPDDVEEGDELSVFVYKDSQNRAIATTQESLIEAGQCAFLHIGNVNSIGAFADIGVDKQLLVPFREQREELEPGDRVMVYCYIDEASERLVGSTKLNKHIDHESADYRKNEEVEITSWYFSDMGLNVIVNGQHTGLIHTGDLLGEFPAGTKRTGYVAQQRPDWKLDIVLRKPGFANIAPEGEKILEMLDREDGFLPYTDKSDPDTIRSVFGMSKKTFKKAIGGLYKGRQVSIEEDGIRRI